MLIVQSRRARKDNASGEGEASGHGWMLEIRVNGMRGSIKV